MIHRIATFNTSREATDCQGALFKAFQVSFFCEREGKRVYVLFDDQDFYGGVGPMRAFAHGFQVGRKKAKGRAKKK